MRPRIEIPGQLLRRAVAFGRTLRDIQRDLRACGIDIALTTIWERLGEAGLRLPRQHDPWTAAKAAERSQQRRYHQTRRRVGKIVGRTVQVRGQWLSSEDEARLLAELQKREEDRLAEQGALARRAREGDMAARLACIRRYGCRVWTAEECHAETLRRRADRRPEGKEHEEASGGGAGVACDGVCRGEGSVQGGSHQKDERHCVRVGPER